MQNKKNLLDKVNTIKNELLKLAEEYAVFYTKVLANVEITIDEEEKKQKINEMREGKIPEGFPKIKYPELLRMLIDQTEEHFKREIEIRRNVNKILPIDEDANERWMQLTRELSDTVDQLGLAIENQ